LASIIKKLAFSKTDSKTSQISCTKTVISYFSSFSLVFLA